MLFVSEKPEKRLAKKMPNGLVANLVGVLSHIHAKRYILTLKYGVLLLNVRGYHFP